MNSTKNTESKSLKKTLSSVFDFKLRLGIFASVYFIYRFVLYFLNYTTLSVLPTLALFLLCMVYIKKPFLSAIYKAVIFIAAVALLYHDSYLLPISTLDLRLDDTLIDKLAYLSGICIDVINLNLIYIFLLILLCMFFIYDYIHSISVCAAIFAFIVLSDLILTTAVTEEVVETAQSETETNPDIPLQTGEPTSDNIEQYLTNFTALESERLISMPAELSPDFKPFNIVIVNICSMATDDIIESKLEKHRLFSMVDYSFNDFNSVSSYSTPASLRLLRANCGQMTESEIYSGRRAECELLTTLEQIGYSSNIYFDHNGVYGNYLKTLNELAGLNPKLNKFSQLKVQYTSFDGTSIYSDADLFSSYITEVAQSGQRNIVTFMNLLSLHDGNRLSGENRSQAYPPRLKLLLDNLCDFIEKIKQSDSNTLLVIVPEHGAAIRGDRMQIAKLREIPTDKITRIPVMVKFIGAKEDKDNEVKIVTGSHSYLAIAELIRRSIENNVFGKDKALCTVDDIFVDLPQTAFISESTNAFYMNFKNTDMYKLKGEEWAPYKK